MTDQSFEQLLKERYALAPVGDPIEIGGAEIYRVQNSWGTNRAEVEVSQEEVPEFQREDVADLAAFAQWNSHQAVVTLRDIGLTSDNKLYVVRDVAEGTPMPQVVANRMQWGNPYSREEVAALLGPVADAVDTFNSSGKASWVSRALDPDNMLQQSDGQIKLAQVGPVVDDGDVSAKENREKLAVFVGELMGAPVDRTLLAESESAADYLNRHLFPEWQATAQSEPTPDAAEGDNWGRDAAQTEVPTTSWAAVPNESTTAPEVQKGGGSTLAYTSSDWESDSDYDATYEPQYEAEEQQPKKNGPGKGIALALAGLLLLAAAGAGGYWWWTNNGKGEPWSGPEAEIAEAYPDIVSEKDGGKGWRGLTCQSVEPEGDQKARIRCADSELGVSLIQYDSPEDRDAALPDSDFDVLERDGSCQIHSHQMPDEEPPAFYQAPQGDKASFLGVIYGESAKEDRAYLNLC
ncbi:hypothetical protein [Corynebacterium sp. CCUG 70398]|uniref:hypothetical protein n=1 Tax=Corynebacterium sp. CCUG 70398 TaxID=2823891 RepID=UPI00210CC563|nr:hypothetical protein [Corynebacterium sp. CCUG 70398]MCQ4623588.1 hypothetical protein [Corynebacterium sp. CCUG 70398]